MSKSKANNNSSTSNKNGRPAKATFEEKKAVVDSYFIVNGDAIRNHGVYKDIADYAQQSGAKLFPHDFSKDKQIRQYIEHKIANVQEPIQSAVLQMYEPLDIDYALTLKGSRLGVLLRDREAYYRRLYNQAVLAIETHTAMQRENGRLKAELEQLKITEAERNEKKRELLQCKEENRRLRQRIRNEIEPEQADAHFRLMFNPGTAVEIVRGIAEANIREIGAIADTTSQEMRVDFTKLFSERGD